MFPQEQFIQAYFLTDNKYKLTGIYTREDKIPIKIFNDEFSIDLKDVFEDDEI